MKNIIIIFIAIFFIGTYNPLNAQSKDIDQFTVQVEGLGCPYCAFGLEKRFKELKGIRLIKIEMKTGTLTFEYPTEKALTLEEVAEQVDKAGYTSAGVSIVRADGKVEATDK